MDALSGTNSIEEPAIGELGVNELDALSDCSSGFGAALDAISVASPSPQSVPLIDASVVPRNLADEKDGEENHGSEVFQLENIFHEEKCLQLTAPVAIRDGDLVSKLCWHGRCAPDDVVDEDAGNQCRAMLESERLCGSTSAAVDAEASSLHASTFKERRRLIVALGLGFEFAMWEKLINGLVTPSDNYPGQGRDPHVYVEGGATTAWTLYARSMRRS